MKVIKHSGDVVDFDRQKLHNSLMKSGASADAVAYILETIESSIYPGISTRRIHKIAKKLLKRVSHSHAARYDLRSALQMLGPAGFFFEKFLARVMGEQGYESKTNMILAGKCIAHEIDIALKKDNKVAMAECKFHAQREGKCDVKVPLYVLSRFNDLKNVVQPIFLDKDFLESCFIITNTRFTSDALAFAACSGLKMLSWDFPKDQGLKDLIDQSGLYPITCLTTLTLFEKEQLLVSGTISVKDLLDNPENLERIVSPTRKKNVIHEAQGLCNALES